MYHVTCLFTHLGVPVRVSVSFQTFVLKTLLHSVGFTSTGDFLYGGGIYGAYVCQQGVYYVICCCTSHSSRIRACMRTSPARLTTSNSYVSTLICSTAPYPLSGCTAEVCLDTRRTPEVSMMLYITVTRID